MHTKKLNYSLDFCMFLSIAQGECRDADACGMGVSSGLLGVGAGSVMCACAVSHRPRARSHVRSRAFHVAQALFPAVTGSHQLRDLHTC